MSLYIGIDPGTIKLGFCVMTEERVVASGTVKLNPRSQAIHDRIIAMTYQMRDLFRRYRHASEIHVGIEDQYFAKNARDALNLSRLTGAIMFVCFDELAVMPELVQTAKLHNLGNIPHGASYGAAAKSIVKQLYGIDCETEDEAVAICIAEILKREHGQLQIV